MIKSVFYNYNYAIVLTDKGEVYSWGKNLHGELGLGHTENENKPKLVQFPNNAKIKCISSTSTNSMAIDEDGNLYVWGSNECNQLGVANETCILEPRKITIYCNIKEKELKVKKIFCSLIGSMIITEDDTLYACGWNEYFSMGINYEYISKLSWIPLPNYVGAKSIEFLEEYSMVIGVDGELYSCGSNKHHQMGLKRGKKETFFKKVCLPEDIKVVSVSSTDYNSIALTDKGELYSWGKNFNGQLGTGDEKNYKIPVKISLPNDIKATFVLAGEENSIAIGEDGNLYAWGIFKNRKLENVEEDFETLHPKIITFPNNTKPICISKRNIHVDEYSSEVTFIVCDDGNLYAIESLSYYGENFFLPYDITKDNENYLPKRINILNGIKIKSVFTNKNSILIVTEDDTLYTLGQNKYGELGISNEEKQLIPMKIELP